MVVIESAKPRKNPNRKKWKVLVGTEARGQRKREKERLNPLFVCERERESTDDGPILWETT